MVIKLKESKSNDNIIMSYEEQISGMVEKITMLLEDIKNQSAFFSASDKVMSLINCRNLIDDLINSISFTNG